MPTVVLLPSKLTIFFDFHFMILYVIGYAVGMDHPTSATNPISQQLSSAFTFANLSKAHTCVGLCYHRIEICFEVNP